jgi:hypothetical protein
MLYCGRRFNWVFPNFVGEVPEGRWGPFWVIYKSFAQRWCLGRNRGGRCAATSPPVLAVLPVPGIRQRKGKRIVYIWPLLRQNTQLHLAEEI